MQFLTWNLSLNKGFSYNLKFGKINFKQHLQNKVVVVLNNQFKDELNDTKRCLDYFPSNDVFGASKNHVSTYVIGDVANLNHLNLPNSENTTIVELENVEKLIENETMIWQRENQFESNSTDDKFQNDNNSVRESFLNKSLAKNDSIYIESDESNQVYQKLNIFESYCCGTPTRNDLIDKLIVIKNQLQKLFPNQVYHFYYTYNPVKTEKGICCKQWCLGTVDIIRGLDLNACFDSPIAFNRKNVNTPEQGDKFTLLKLLPFEKKLLLLNKNLDFEENLNMIHAVIISDLVEELDIYRKNPWSGLLNKVIIGSKLILLNTFIKEAPAFLENETTRKIIYKIIIDYSYCTCKITSKRDYLWFNRNRRIVRSVCETKLGSFIRLYFSKENQAIQTKIEELINTNEDKDELFKLLINPYYRSVLYNKDFNNFIIDKSSFKLDRVNQTKIKFGENNFYDKTTESYDISARNEALDKCRNNCYYDVSAKWNEFVDMNTTVKEKWGKINK